MPLGLAPQRQTFIRSTNVHTFDKRSYVRQTFIRSTNVHTFDKRSYVRQTFIHTFIHSYVHTYIHTYIRSYIHTFIHTTFIHHNIIHSYIYSYIHTYTTTSTGERSARASEEKKKSSYVPGMCHNRSMTTNHIIIHMIPKAKASADVHGTCHGIP